MRLNLFRSLERLTDKARSQRINRRLHLGLRSEAHGLIDGTQLAGLLLKRKVRLRPQETVSAVFARFLGISKIGPYRRRQGFAIIGEDDGSCLACHHSLGMRPGIAGHDSRT